MLLCYRQILSALDPMAEPTSPPPNSLTGGSRGADSPLPTDAEDSLNDYINRLETLQERLGNGKTPK